MKILVIGNGGREHAIVWRISRDTAEHQIFCAPGNAGTAALATNVNIGVTDVDAIVAWAEKERPDLTIVGPEAPLVAGLTDALRAKNFLVFGPSRDAARLEGSKTFAKEIMQAAGVPTAASRAFSTFDEAIAYLDKVGVPVVVKADGLAAGKGVTVCMTRDEAVHALDEALNDKVFGVAGGQVLVEEFLEGEEASILALIDGTNIVMLASSQDHKRAYDGDLGPNTGGMGAYSPAPVVTDELWPLIREQVFERTLNELHKRGMTYQGVLYAGIMITQDGPKVLEFNCRFGDPETQVVLPRWIGDMVPAFKACATGTLSEDMVAWCPEHAATIVIASQGYPGNYPKNRVIDGLQDVAENNTDAIVFHAGTAINDQREVVTNGGRVLAVTGVGKTLQRAVCTAYEAASGIHFDGGWYRNDIAWRAL
ncbi:MAG: phosphoribosylamine--glycine ligase [Spartobacteria bacterium]|nr:phosphoribosylamine--glycine ligase [Spartobacteria bacterium]